MLELRAGSVTVLVDENAGGRLASLVIDGQERLVTAPNSGGDPMRWGSYPMVPYAGRVRLGEFAHGGAVHHVPVTLGPHAIHGTVLQAGCTVERATASEIVMRAALGEDWPWPGSCAQVVRLDDSTLMLTLTLSADAVPFPGQVGWHPWFTDGGVAPALTFAARAMYERDGDGIPSGRLVAPAEHPWDDCFVDVVAGPVLRYRDGRELALASDCDHWVVFEPGDALCVEPQSGPPDEFNLSPRLVTPDEPLVRSMSLAWA
jgi:aldose 1-epimerase